MSRIEYNKLIRDRIPDIIEAEGKCYHVETMTETEYRQALLTKLSEEAQEASTASAEKLVTELADLYEVIDAVMAAYGIEPSTVLNEQTERRNKRGGFERRFKLLWIEEKDK